MEIIHTYRARPSRKEETLNKDMILEYVLLFPARKILLWGSGVDKGTLVIQEKVHEDVKYLDDHSCYRFM